MKIVRGIPVQKFLELVGQRFGPEKREGCAQHIRNSRTSPNSGSSGHLFPSSPRIIDVKGKLDMRSLQYQ